MPDTQFDLLGQMLKRSSLVTQQQLEAALERQKQVKKRIGEILLEMDHLAEDDLVRVLAEQIGIEAAEKRGLEAPAMDMVRLIPEPFAREHLVLPLRKAGDALEVAMADPEDVATVDHLRKLAKCEVLPRLAGRAALARAIGRAYDSARKVGEVDDVLSVLELGAAEEVDAKALDLSAQKDVGDAPIVRLVNLILTGALKDRATDIHVEPQPDRLVVRYRVDGALLEAMSAPMKSHPGAVSRVKILSKLNIAETRLPQDGRFTVKLPEREVDVRVSILPTVLGEKIVMRLLDKGAFNLSLANLGFDPDDLEIFRRAIRMPYGIVIISGPTGSGKSTSLYAALKEIRSVEDNIVTVEDPVEYQMEGITQVATNEAIGLTFGSTLRSILRQDPDKVLIGEIRDRETADIAMKFALTGHLVFTTLHANDTPSTLTRLVDIGVPPFLAGSSVVLVMAQRLVRRICEECKQPYAPSAEESDLAGLQGAERSGPFYHGKGCARCRNTGYYGRVGIFELMAVNKGIRQLIFAGADQERVRQQALDQGMRTLHRSAVRKLLAGVTTFREVIKTTVEEF